MKKPGKNKTVGMAWVGEWYDGTLGWVLPRHLSDTADNFFVADAAPPPEDAAKVAFTSFLQLKLASRGEVTNSVEFQRIKGLPRRHLDLDTVQDVTPLVAKTGGTMTLRPIQSAMLIEAARADGLFAAVGVGFGKTLASLLLPTAMCAERAVLLVPSALKKKTLDEIRDVYAPHFDLPLDRLTIVSYNELSTAKTADILERLNPDVIIADECHALRHKTSARTKRFMRFAKEHPACRFAFLSGTMTTRSIKDYAHLIELALRKNSPLPNGYHEVRDWAGAIDVKPEYVMMPGVLRQFCEPDETTRAGYRRRLIETPGVVATQESAIGASLLIRRLAPRVPDVVEQALARTRKLWKVGDEEITNPLDLARYLKQLACGFYYRWVWPDGVVDHEWLEARAAWHKEIRGILRQSRAGLDSPLLCAQAAERGTWKSETWAAWKAVKGRKPPPTEAVWLDSFLVEEAIAWGQRECGEGPSIIWYEHRELGEQIARVAGLPLYDAGTDASHERAPLIVCSMRCQGTGKNLQHYSRNLFTSMPPNGATFEQVAGRTHRDGQEADEVVVDWFGHTPETNEALAAVIDDAEYQQETFGPQKVLYATKL